MKTIPLLSISATACLLLASCSDSSKQAEWKPGDTIPLFNGYSLEGWSPVLEAGTPAAEEVWRSDEGLLIGSGERPGYLRTDASFQNFELVVDWTWVTTEDSEELAGDAGVLLRIAEAPGKTMPKCIEVQLMPGSEGDLWAYHGAKLEGDSARLTTDSGNEELGDVIGLERSADAELKSGDPDRLVVTLRDGNLEVKVNGKVVNEASGLDAISGPVGLQAAGGTIQFDYVQLSPL